MPDRWIELGAFLRSRRARVPSPPAAPGRLRRVPGLRREELAQAASVSSAYYTRLEQGRAPRVSDEVLAAVCRALALDDAEWAHVWRLARPAPPRASSGSSEHVRGPLAALVRTLMPTPALVLGRDRHLLDWNASAHALHAPHLDATVVEDPDRRPWWPALLFTDPQVSELFVDWDDKARDTAADLRIELGRRADDDRLAALVSGLLEQSAEFARLWGEQRVAPCSFHDRTYRHADVGLIDLHDEFLELSDDGGQRLAVFSAAPGSPGADALMRLAASLSTTSGALP